MDKRTRALAAENEIEEKENLGCQRGNLYRYRRLSASFTSACI